MKNRLAGGTAHRPREATLYTRWVTREPREDLGGRRGDHAGHLDHRFHAALAAGSLTRVFWNDATRQPSSSSTST